MNKENLKWFDRKRLWCGLPWTFTEYGLSEDRLYITDGFLTTTHHDTRLYRVLNTSIRQTLIQKMFGLGTIHIDSTDKDMNCIDLINVKNCHEVKKLIDDLVEEERIKNKVVIREYATDNLDEHNH